MQPAPIHTVISLQRTGFSLMLSILNEILKRKHSPRMLSETNQRLNRVLPFLSHQTNKRYQKFFEKHGLGDRLLFNGEFQLLVGGPKWCALEFPDDIFVRKYFGVKGMGDFLMVVRYPKELFNYYPIMHSTKAPEQWLACYGSKTRNWLTSYRNPIDVFNSAAHSINALTSEYIQRYSGHQDEESIRREIGLSKLSDPKVCKGLIKYQIDYWRKYFPIAKHFKFYRWEDLILNPVKTIQQMAEMVGVRLTESEARNIWKPRDHRNLLNHHAHNFRINKGVVGDWKNSLIPEHIELFKALGGQEIFDELGYDWPALNRPLNEYQKTIQRYWSSGSPYKIKDNDLAGFAFNKSNIDASDYEFFSIPEKGRVQIERSDLKDQELLHKFRDYAVEVNERLTSIIKQIIHASSNEESGAILTREYGQRATTNFLSVLQCSAIELERNIERFLCTNREKSFIIWGMGNDFNRWVERSSRTKSIIDQPNIYLADRTRAGTTLYGKDILSPDRALKLTHCSVLPFVFSYETRHSILQTCQRQNISFIDLHSILKVSS